MNSKLYSQEFKCDRKIFKIFRKFFFILQYSLDTKTLTINEVYQYVKYLIININKYIISAKNWDFGIFSIAGDKKNKIEILDYIDYHLRIKSYITSTCIIV